MTDKPRAVFVATTPLAVNAFLISHLEALSQHFRITLCVNTDAHQLDDRVRSFGDVVHVGFRREISVFHDIGCLWTLFFILIKQRPKTIHSITPKAGLIAMIASFLARVPNRFHTFTGQVWATRRFVLRMLLKNLDRLIVVTATRVFADSASQCRFLKDQRVARSIKVLGSGSISGVDLEKFREDPIARRALRDKHRCDQDTMLFLFVGRLNRDKGIFDLILAFSQLPKELPNAELWIVGPDDEGISDELQVLANNSPRPIRILGATDSPQTFMAAADVFVLPSYREGFGSVLIEAAACGVPAISYEIDGVVDAVENGSSGILVDVGQIQELINAMVLLVREPNLRAKLGRRAKQRVEGRFSSRQVTEAWLAFYLGLISE